MAVIAATAVSFLGLCVPAHAESAEATRAADWIVENCSSEADWKASTVADQVLALVSTGSGAYDEAISTRLVYLKAQSSAAVKDSPETAAKLAVVAQATGQDAADFGGTDLIETVKNSVKDDGAFGAWPGPFASGLGMIALARAGQAIPPAMVTYLLTYVSADGGFHYSPQQSVGDPDSTALAVLGLQAADSKDPALNAALLWLETTQRGDGGWDSYSPVNSAGMAGPLLPAAAKDKAAAFVATQQLPSGGLKTGAADAPTADALATAQGIFALTNQTYRTVAASAADPAPAPDGPESASAADVVIGGLAVVVMGGGLWVAARRSRR